MQLAGALSCDSVTANSLTQVAEDSRCVPVGEHLVHDRTDGDVRPRRQSRSEWTITPGAGELAATGWIGDQ